MKHNYTVINKLDISINYGDAFIMLGIVSTNTDYQLAHFINKALDIHFSKYDDFVFNGSGKKKYPYSWYYCFSEELKVNAYLIANYHRAKKLLPEYKQIDYFIVLKIILMKSSLMRLLIPSVVLKK